MAVTILQWPEGFVLDPTDIAYEVNFNPGDPDALFGSALHGLTDGDVVYIKAHVEDYAGFFVVAVYDANSFWIRGEDGVKVPYISDDDGYYNNSTLTHGWSAVHLPITYRLSSDLYPINSVDTSRNINSVQDANGYTVLQLSGSLGTVHSYDFVTITVPNDTELSGVYQILEYISDTVLLINLEYDSTNDFTSATAIKHYNNYNILVRVYAGINASHEWAAQKPYELAATLKFVPDENNEVFFSINEILKSYIETRNNLVLGTLPNNIDFWANFYIEIAESYDDSDGYSFGSFTGSYTSDQSNFEGYAVNSKLEFKNIHSGHLSEYLMINSASKFLTLFTIPVLFQCGSDTPDCYSDISWIKIDDLPVTVKKEFYSDGVLSLTETESNDEDYGVIRTELEANCDYDRLDITLQVDNTVGTNSIMRNTAGNTSTSFDFFIPAGTTPPGDYSYTVAISSGVTGGDIAFALLLYVYFDGTSETIANISRTTVGTTTASNVSFPIPSKSVVAVTLVATITDNAPGGLIAAVNVSFDIDESTTVISETKQFKIDCNCFQQEIRLTWLNNLGGFDYWAFTAQKDHIREIQEAITTKKNILPNWPKSYGSDADTIKRQTKRVSNKAYTVRSQFISEDEQDAIAYIKSSLLVQIINSRIDRRTVLVDTDSFVMRKDGDKTFEVAFNISFTDDIPVQTL